MNICSQQIEEKSQSILCGADIWVDMLNIGKYRKQIITSVQRKVIAELLACTRQYLKPHLWS